MASKRVQIQTCLAEPTLVLFATSAAWFQCILHSNIIWQDVTTNIIPIAIAGVMTKTKTTAGRKPHQEEKGRWGWWWRQDDKGLEGFQASSFFGGDPHQGILNFEDSKTNSVATNNHRRKWRYAFFPYIDLQETTIIQVSSSTTDYSPQGGRTYGA